jgi:hypothetical protein
LLFAISWVPSVSIKTLFQDCYHRRRRIDNTFKLRLTFVLKIWRRSKIAITKQIFWNITIYFALKMSNFIANRNMDNQVICPGKKRERCFEDDVEEVRSISPPIESFPRRPLNRTRSQQFIGLSEGIILNSMTTTNNNNHRNVDSYGWFLALDKNWKIRWLIKWRPSI